jgi:alpha-galactosidase
MALDKVSRDCFDLNQTPSRIRVRNSQTVFPNILFAAVFICAAAVVVMPKPPSSDSTPLLAATPPMGWNSWDAYGETVSETDIRANAKWMAEHLKSYGWEHVVVDSGWYVTNHSAGTNAEAHNSAWTLSAATRPP